MKRGGQRKGSGAKKKDPTSTISIRHKKNIVDKVKKKHAKKDLQKLGQCWLNELIKNE